MSDVDPCLSLGEGGTPLLEASRLGRLLGLKRLFFKLESRNPTGTIADRGSVAGVQRARELGFTRVGVVSIDRLAPSLAAYAARAGLGCSVLLPAPADEPIWHAVTAYGARAVQVDAPYSSLLAASARLGARARTYFVNADDPFRLEGVKTLAFEVAELCPGGPPEWLLVGLESGEEARAMSKGFQEWHRAGLSSTEPGLIAVHPDQVDERDVWTARGLLAAEEGLVVSSDSAAAFARLVGDVRAGTIGAGDRVVVVLSGLGPADRGQVAGAGSRPIETTLGRLAAVLGDPAP